MIAIEPTPATVEPVHTITADAWFKLTDAPTVKDRYSDATFVPTLGWWSHQWTAQFGEESVRVAVTSDSPIFAEFTPDNAPAWIPRPPDGWDAGVLAAIARTAQ